MGEGKDGERKEGRWKEVMGMKGGREEGRKGGKEIGLISKLELLLYCLPAWRGVACRVVGKNSNIPHSHYYSPALPSTLRGLRYVYSVDHFYEFRSRLFGLRHLFFFPVLYISATVPHSCRSVFHLREMCV